MSLDLGLLEALRARLMNAAGTHHVMSLHATVPWARVGSWLVKAKEELLVALKPYGAWGLLILSLIDSAAIPLIFLDPLIVTYGAADHRMAIIYCLMGALGSAAGSLLPYYLGRAGGELFLLKRINRARYEKLRDRFERQEFLAIMLPAMCPPPMPVKIFELAAGVFEMRPRSFFLAIAAGKFFRFVIETVLVILYGPAILNTFLTLLHRHLAVVLGVTGVLLMVLLVWVVRKLFERRSGVALPVEDEDEIAAEPGDVL